MKYPTTILAWAENRFLAIGRARLWAALRTMDAGLLSSAGFEPDLLHLGPDAWPWQSGSQAIIWSTDTRIDQRGTPVPIASTDQLLKIETDITSQSLDSEIRHEAA